MSSPRSPLAFAVIATLVAAPSVAAAHIQMVNPAPRSLTQKTRPCGPVSSTRGPNVTVLAPGAMLEVRWNETINHPGYYRISLDLDGQDFTIPPAPGNTTLNTNVVMDMIPDVANPAYRFMIQMPNLTCENCTLQVIQLMTDKPPYTTDANSDDIYFQCADIALRNPGTLDAGTDAAVAPDAAQNSDGGVGADEVTGGCGCRTSHPQPAGIALALLVLGISTRRRRRP